MSVLTGNKDTDILVLMQLKDHELGPVCAANKYLNSLCNEDTFWMNRIISNLNKTCLEAKKIPLFKEDNCENLGEGIKQVKIYFGFETYRELNTYFQGFTKGMQYAIFEIAAFNRAEYDEFLRNIVKIEQKLLPKYINYNELLYYLRRELVKEIYKGMNGIIYLRNALPENIQGITKMKPVRKKRLAEPYIELTKIDF